MIVQGLNFNIYIQSSFILWVIQRPLPWSIISSILPERTAFQAPVCVNVRKPQGLFCGARHTNQPAGRKIPCLHPSTWLNSWLWLKFHDFMLVVAKGALIDWSEIYSAVADCRKKKGGQGRLCRRLYHRWVSHSLAHPMFQVALSKQFPFFLLLTCLFSLSVSENKPAISKKRSPNFWFIWPLWPPPPQLLTFFVLKLSTCVLKKKWGQSIGHSPVVVQMGWHMETISGPGALQSKVGGSVQNLWRTA